MCTLTCICCVHVYTCMCVLQVHAVARIASTRKNHIHSAQASKSYKFFSPNPNHNAFSNPKPIPNKPITNLNLHLILVLTLNLIVNSFSFGKTRILGNYLSGPVYGKVFRDNFTMIQGYRVRIRVSDM